MPEDKMGRDITKRIKAMGQYSGKLASSTAKLFLASGKEIFSLKMPTLVSMVDTNREIIDSTAKFLRNPTDVINRSINRAMETEDAKSIMRFAKNALDDLKSGDLYDANRDRNSTTSAIDDLMNDFGGFDMSGFDDNADWTESESDDGLIHAEAAIADVQEENASKRTAATIEAIGASTEVLSNTVNANGQANIRLSIKQHSQMMNVMSNVLTAQAASITALDTTAKSALAVARESHSQIMSEMQKMTNLLEEIRDGVKPKQKQNEYKEQASPFGSRGELDIKQYLKQIGKNVEDRYGIGSKASMLTGGMGIKDLLELVSDNPWQLLSTAIVDKLIPQKLKNQMERTDKNLANFFPALFDKLAAKNSNNIGEDFSFKNEILSLFGVRQRSRTSIDTAIRDVNAQTAFTKRTATAIEIVVPALLSQINSSISGAPVQTFDYSKGKFVNATSVLAKYYHSANDLVGSMGTAQDVIRMSDNFNWRTTKEKEEFQKYLYQFFQYKANSGSNNFINPYQDAEEFKESMPSGTNKEQYYNLLTGMLKAMPNNMLMQLSTDVFDARRDRDKRNNTINQELRDNGLLAAFTGIVDDKVSNAIEYATKKERVGLSTEGISKIVSDKRALAIKAGGVQASNIILNDILATLRKGIITYSYGMGKISSDSTQPLLRDVLNAATKQKDLEAKILASAEAPKLREAARTEEERERSRKKERESDPTLDNLFVGPNIDSDTAGLMMAHALAKRTTTETADNKLVEFARRYSEQLSGSASDVLDQTGTKGVFDAIKKMAGTPFSFMDQALKTMDAFMFKMLYGEDAAITLENGGEPSLMKSVIQAVKVQFTNAKDWFAANIGDPLKKFFMDKDKGLIPRIGRSLLDYISPVTNKVVDKAKGIRDRAVGRVIGTKDESSGQYSGGKFSSTINKVKDVGGTIETRMTGAIDRLLYGDNAKTNRKGVGSYMDIDEHGNVVSGRTYGGVIGKLRQGFDNVKEYLFGKEGEDNDSKRKFKLVTDEVNKALPDMTIGAGIGLLGSLVLPGGPLLGAIIGASGGFLKSSEKFKEYLFGESDTRTEVDPVTGKIRTIKTRKGNALISPEVYEGFKKFAPSTTKGAMIGAVAGGLGLLPFGIGPLLGTVFGSIGGMASASDQIKTMIFGDYKDPKSGLISKEFRDKVKAQIKRVAPSAIGGAALGAGAWGAISSLGIIPGLSLIPGGPIFGMLGAITGATNADSINKFLFGDEVEVTEEVKDKDGNVTGTKKRKKREGGIFGSVFDTAKNKLVEPFARRVDKVGKSIGSWFKDSIISPLNNSMKPLKDNISKAGENIKNSLHNIGEKITDGINNVFERNLGQPLGEFFRDKIIKPLDNMAKRIFGAIGKVIGAIISAPFKALEFIMTGDVVREDGSTLADRRSDAREKYRKRRAEKRAQWKEKRKVKREERMGTRIGAISEDGERISGGVQGAFQKFRNKITGLFSGGETSDINSSETTSVTETKNGGKSSISDADFYNNTNVISASGLVSSTTPASISEKDVIPKDTPDQSDSAQSAGRKLSFWEAAKQRAIDKKAAKAERDKQRQDIAIQKQQARDERKLAVAEHSANKAKLKADSSAHVGTEQEKKERKTFKKTNNEYLSDISKYTKKTYEELKGQVNGVGWNTGYIKALLEKQYGFGLSNDELPEEMEGSGKQIRKRRGIIRRAADKVFGFFGGVGDKIGGAIDKVKGTLSFIFHPIQMFMDALGTAKEAILSFGSTIFDLIKAAAAGLGKMISGAAKVVGNAVLGASRFIAGAAKGIGSAIGDAFHLVTGIVSDAGYALSGVVAGLVDVAAEVAPDIARGIWGGMKFVGKTVMKGAKGAAKIAGKGAKWLFNKITGGDPTDPDGVRTKIKKIGTFEISGGHLDEITDSVSINLGGKLTPLPFPYVNVARGKIVNRNSSAAIPVYITGVDSYVEMLVKMRNGQSSDESSDSTVDDILSDNSNDTDGINEDGENLTPKKHKRSIRGIIQQKMQQKRDDFRNFMRKYSSTDKSAESAADSAQSYDKAMNSAKSMEEVQAIQAAQQLNANNAVISGSSGEVSEKGGSSLLDLLGGKTGAIVKGALGFLSVAAPALFHFTSPDGNKAWGAENLGINILRKLGINKLSPAKIAEYVMNPSAAATAAGEAAQAGTRAGSKMARGIGRLGNIGSIVEWMRNPAAAEAAASANKLMGKSSLAPRLAGTIGKGASAIASGTKNLIGKAGTFIRSNADDVLRAAVGSADDLASVGPVKQAIAKVLKSLLNNKTVMNLFGKLKTKIPAIISKLTNFLSGEVLEKAMKSSAMTNAKATAKQIATFATGGLLAVGFAIYDFISGMGNSAKYFGIYGDEVNLGMRLTSGVCNTLGGLLSLIPYVGGPLSIAAALFMKPIVTLIYGLLNGEDAKNELAAQQNQLKAATESYNAKNGTSLSPEEYAKKFNSDGTEKLPWYKALGHGIVSLFTNPDPKWTSTNPYVSGKPTAEYTPYTIGPAVPTNTNTTSSSNYTPYTIGPVIPANNAAGSGYGLGWGRGAVKPMSQRSSRYNRNSKNMAQAGCGPTAASIVASAYGKNLNPETMSNLAYGMGMRATDGGTNPEFFSQAANIFGSGFGMKQGPTDTGMINNNLAKGQPVVMMGKGGSYGPHMHYMVAEGQTGRGKYSVVDPMTGSRKQVGAQALVKNTKSTIYSYGTGRWGTGLPAEDEAAAKASSRNADTAADAQNKLVNALGSIEGQLHYNTSSLEKQNPDAVIEGKRWGSCASTVAWAYNKVLGYLPGGTDNFASSSRQATDPNFTTIYKKSGSTQPDEKALKPGDILYFNWNSPNAYKTPGHTEMYIGNGMTYSHGGGQKGEEMGPSKKQFNTYRKSRVMLARRYNPFLNGSQITANAVDGSTISTGGMTGTTDGTSSIVTESDGSNAGWFSGTVGAIALDRISNLLGGVGTVMDNTLAPILGLSTVTQATETTPQSQKTFVNNKSKAGARTKTQDIKGNTNSEKVWNYLIQAGLSKEAVAGLMGNLHAESAINPINVENWYNKRLGLDDEEYTKQVDSGAIGKDRFLKTASGGKFGYGLAQWTWPSRKEGLYDLAKSRGTSIGDTGTQLDYLWNELNGSYKSSVLDKLKQTGSVKDASTIVLKNFENPENADSQINTRAGYAQTYYDLYANQEFGGGVGIGKKQVDLPDLGFGTGTEASDANISALNDRIRRINNLIANTRESADSAQSDDMVAKMTNVITQATTASPETDSTLKMIATALTTMVGLLTDIKKNTEPATSADIAPSKQSATSSKRGGKYGNLPVAEANVDSENDYEVGAKIIDRLTSK